MPLTVPDPDDAARLREEALGWFVRRQSGHWAPGEARRFDDWLAADPRHAQALARCQDPWDGFDGMPADLVQRLRRPQRDAPAPSRRRFLRPALVLAGSAAVAGGAGFFAWQQVQAQPTWTQAVRTERGRQQALTLPDGSQVRLNTATRLELAYYRDRREVRLLDGQAFFSVQPDATRPFVVQAGPVRVSVVGTRFSVRHTPELHGNDGVQVAVEQGRVRVSGAHAHAAPPVWLAQGQAVASDRAGRLGPIDRVAADQIATWREQRVSFVNTPLGEALAELQRYGDTGLVVRDPAVAALRLTATLDPRQAATLRQALPRILPVRLQPQGDVTELVAAP